jgi:hypothetical protein
MTNRVSYAPQDFQKMCKQAERDHEAKKLVVLMDRVKKQIAAQKDVGEPGESAKRPVAAITDSARLPSRTVPFER